MPADVRDLLCIPLNATLFHEDEVLYSMIIHCHFKMHFAPRRICLTQTKMQPVTSHGFHYH